MWERKRTHVSAGRGSDGTLARLRHVPTERGAI